MPAYRLYCLNGGGHISEAEWIAADSDEEAVEYALGKKHPVPCELWDRRRLVAKIPAHSGD